MKGSTWFNNMGLPTFTTACERANLGSTQFESECVKWHPCEKGNRLAGVGRTGWLVYLGGTYRLLVEGEGPNGLLVEGEGQTGC